MPFAALNGIDVYFDLHGTFETLSYDQRGLGQTSKPGSDYTTADYADDAAALIHAMGWARCHVTIVEFLESAGSAS